MPNTMTLQLFSLWVLGVNVGAIIARAINTGAAQSWVSLTFVLVASVFVFLTLKMRLAKVATALFCFLLLSSSAHADTLLTTVSSQLTNTCYANEVGCGIASFGLQMTRGFPPVPFPVGPDRIGQTTRIEVASLSFLFGAAFQDWNVAGALTSPGIGPGPRFHFDGHSGFLRQEILPFADLFVTGDHLGVNGGTITVESLFTPPDGLSFAGTPHSWSAVEFDQDDWIHTPTPLGYEPVTLVYTLRFYSAVPEPTAAVMLLSLVLVGCVRGHRHGAV